jgi:hypothetical protein
MNRLRIGYPASLAGKPACLSLAQEYDDDYCHSTTCVPAALFHSFAGHRTRTVWTGPLCTALQLVRARLGFDALHAARWDSSISSARCRGMGREQRNCDSRRRMPISGHVLRIVVHPCDTMRRSARPAYLSGEDPRQCARSQSGFHGRFFNNLRKQYVLFDTPLLEVSKRELDVLALLPRCH